MAPTWPRLPPTATGFPVTVPVTASPRNIEIVSITQAITRASVFTSGAGTSRSGPSIKATSIV